MTEDQIKHMVNRFLAWRLPEPFRPDNGISFKPPYSEEPMRSRHWPIGTNLLDANQATAMIRHMLEGLPAEGPVPLERGQVVCPDCEGEGVVAAGSVNDGTLTISGFADCQRCEGKGWIVDTFAVAPLPALSQVEEVLWLFREFVQRNVTQWQAGAGVCHHPMWQVLAEVIGDRPSPTTGPFYAFIQHLPKWSHLDGDPGNSVPALLGPVDFGEPDSTAIAETLHKAAAFIERQQDEIKALNTLLGRWSDMARRLMAPDPDLEDKA